MKKILFVLLTICAIIMFAGLTSGCGSKYNNMSLTVSVEDLVIYLSDDEGIVLPSEAFLNEAEFNANIKTDDKSISKNVLISLENQSIASISKTYDEDNTANITVTALMQGQTRILVMSAEGNKKAYINLEVIIPATSMLFESELNMALSVGSTYQLDASELLNFAPATTSQRDVIWTASSTDITIDSNNLITVVSIPTSKHVTLTATNADNRNLFSSIEVYIYEALDSSSISITNTADNSLLNLEETIMLAKNSSGNPMNLNINLPTSDDEFMIYGISGDSTSLVVDKVNANNFNIVGVENATTTITFRIGVEGFNVQSYLDIVLNISIIDIVNKVYINSNSSSSSINVYDAYSTEGTSLFGTKITFSVTPTNATNQTIALGISSADITKLSNLVFVDSAGRTITDITTYTLSSNGYIYVRAKNYTSQTVNLIAYGNSSVLNGEYIVQNTISIKVKTAISEIEFPNATEFVDITKTTNTALSDDDKWTEINYLVNGEDTDLVENVDWASLSVKLSNTNIISYKLISGKLYVKGITIGTCNLTLKSSSGYYGNVEVKVVKPGTNIQLDVDTTKYVDYIASVDRNDDNIITNIYAETASYFYIAFACSPSNITIWDVNYSSSNSSILSITANALVHTMSVGTATITITGSYGFLFDDGTITNQDFTITCEVNCFKPITAFNISKESVNLYDVKDIGFLSQNDYSSINYEIIMNSNASIKSSDVQYFVRNSSSEWVENSDGSRTLNTNNGILIDYGTGESKFVANISDANIEIAYVYIYAKVEEYGRIYTSYSTIKITRAQTLTNIYLLNVDNQGVYFKTGDGLNTLDNSFTINTKTMPSEAINQATYFYPYYVDNGDYVNSSVVQIGADGTVMPLKAGSCTVRVVPASSILDLNNDGTLTDSEIKQCVFNSSVYTECLVEVADGGLDNPFRIYSITDFLSISNGLQYHYVLANSIDLSNISFSTFGSLDNAFTGSLSGQLKILNSNGETTYINSKLLGLNFNYNNTNSTQDLSYGLFSYIYGNWDNETDDWAYASVSNLTIEVKSITITVNNSSVYNLYSGVIAGKLAGKLTNVNVTLKGDYKVIVLDEANSYIGGLVGLVTNQQNTNGSQIYTSSINECSIKVQNDSELYYSGDNDLINIGGIVGLNYGSISGEYTFHEDLETTENLVVYAFMNYDNSTTDSFVNIIVETINSSNICVGGVVGYNIGTIKQMSNAGKVKVGKNVNDVFTLYGENVGGIAGYSSGVIYNVTSSSSIYGLNCIGGIVGYSTGSISYASYESLITPTLAYNIMGNNYVGALVGYQDGGSIVFAYAVEYKLDDTSSLFASGDFVGGLIGNAVGCNISYVWSNMNIYASNTSSKIGGLIGSANGVALTKAYSRSNILGLSTLSAGFISNVSSCTITESYSSTNLNNFIVTGTVSGTNFFEGTGTSGGASGKTSAELKNLSTYSAWGMILTGWQIQTSINDGYPSLVYTVSGIGYSFISETPLSFEIIAKDSVSGKFINVENDKIVLYMNETSDGTIEQYELSDLIDIIVTPTINKVVNATVEVIYGQDVLQIVNGVITIFKMGLVEIKITSSINADAYDIMQIYVACGATSMEISTQTGDDIDELSIKKGSSVALNLTTSNTQNYGNAISSSKIGLAIAGFMNADGTISYLSADYADIITYKNTKYLSMDYNYPIVIVGNNTSDGLISAVAQGYIKAQFLTEGSLTDTIVFVEELKQIFTYEVYTGVSEITINQAEQGITPNETAQITVNVKTDLLTDYIGTINVYQNNVLFDNFTITLNDGVIEPTFSDYTVTNANSNFKVEIIEVNCNYVDEILKSIDFVFEISVLDNLVGIEIFSYYDFVFTAYGKEQNDSKFSKTWTLGLQPQEILKINVLHFPDGILNEDEVAQNTIAGGVYGLLKINVYPSFAQFDTIEIVSSEQSSEHITFTQVVYNEDTNSVSDAYIFQSNKIITNGIQLKLISNLVSSSNATYDFDGNLYVTTLIQSGMTEDLPFVVTIKAYNDGLLVYTQTKTLYTQFSPSVVIDIEDKYNGTIAKGTIINVPMNVRSLNGNLKLSATMTDALTGESLDTNKIMASGDTVYTTKFVGSTIGTLQIAIDVPSGAVITITAILTTVINNLTYVKTSQVTLSVVDYIINEVYILDATEDGLQVGLNNGKTLIAKIDAICASETDSGFGQVTSYADYYNDIINKIEAMELTISQKTNVWFSRTAVTGGYTYTTILDTDFNEMNYKCIKVDEDSASYLAIVGTTINDDSVISLICDFYYSWRLIDGVYQFGINFTIEENDLNEITKPSLISKDYSCNVNVVDFSTEDNPTPVYTSEEFINMTEGVNYILLSDIELTNWEPIEASFSSLDGNGKIITINSFSADWLSEVESTKNVGIWTTIDEDTIIKNLRIDIAPILSSESTSTFDLTGMETVNFGILAGTNNGTVTNVDILRIATQTELTSGVYNDAWDLTVNTDLILNQSYLTHYIGTFVGVNNGFITNSRVGSIRTGIGVSESTNSVDTLQSVVGINLVANSNVGGFVGYNNNTISTSSVENVVITNNSVIASKSALGGFVAVNYYDGKINSCLAVGKDDVNLTSNGNIAGFVMTNNGAIGDSYCDFTMTTPATCAGFVFENESLASISTSYTLCDVVFTSGESTTVNTSAYRPFTGVDDFNIIQNDGEISYCYYLELNELYEYADEEASGLNSEEIKDIDNFVGFANVLNNTDWAGEGTWLQGEDYPTLSCISNISVSSRSLIDTQEISDTDVYIYNYDLGFEIGSQLNPVLIATPEKFNTIFDVQSDYVDDTTFEFDSSYVLIIKDLDFKTTSETAGGLNSSNVIFNGSLDGNFMNLSNIELTGQFALENTENSTSNLADKDEFGLFARLDDALVKNLDLQFSEVSATEFGVVGGLAGVALDSVVLGIIIDCEGVTLQGKNISGGLLGLAVGDCQIQRIQTNISVRATYRAGTSGIQGLSETIDDQNIANVYETDDASILYYTTLYNNGNLPNSNVSYAGGIIGALTNENDQTISTVLSLKASGGIAIGAERVGGCIGYVGEKCIIYDVLFDISITLTNSNLSLELSGLTYTGGLVGENHGKIEKSRVTYGDEDELTSVDSAISGTLSGKTNLFTGSIEYAGGLVGYNCLGTIKDCYSRVDVINSSANYVGGLVGLNLGGSYDSVYATGCVSGSIAGGGIIGYASCATSDDEYIEEFKNVVALNNYSLTVANSANSASTIFKLGALIGYYNSGDISKLFIIDFYNKFSDVKVVVDVPLNSTSTSFVTLPIIAKCSNSNLIDSINNEINGTIIEDEGFVNRAYFGTTDKISYTILKDDYATFETFSTDDWVIANTDFPILNISVQQTAITITDENKHLTKYLFNTYKNGYFIFTVDVNLNSISDGGDLELSGNEKWSELGDSSNAFTGTIRGTKEIRSGVACYPTITLADNYALINYADSAQIYGLNFNYVGTRATSDANIYGLVANNATNCRFEDILIEQTSSLTMAFTDTSLIVVGGVVGYANGCSFYNVESNLSFVMTVSNSNLETNIFGGIVAQMDNGALYDCEYNGIMNIRGGSFIIGGLIGDASSVIVSNGGLNEGGHIEATQISTANALSSIIIGGLIGNADAVKITKAVTCETSSYNSDIILNIASITNVYLGGLIGYGISSTISTSKNSSRILINEASNYQSSQTSYVGGLIGFAGVGVTLASSQNSAVIENNLGGECYLGGLIGEIYYSLLSNSTLITKCSNSGELKLSSHTSAYFGGLIGYAVSTQTVSNKKIVPYIEKSYNEANLYTNYDEYKSASLEIIGGIVGNIKQMCVKNCYSVGNINSNTNLSNGVLYAGGFVGQTLSSSVIQNSYSATIVTSSIYNEDYHLRGFIGNNASASVEYCVYVAENTIQYDGSAKAISYADLFNRTTVSNWSISANDDESSIWVYENGVSIPYLSGMKPYSEEGNVYNPVKITTASQLSELSGNEYYLIINNIVLTTSINILEFNGYLNGGQFSVSYENISSSTAPLISTNNGIITCLNIVNININSIADGTVLGGLCEINNGIINSTSVSGTISTSNTLNYCIIGGLVGKNNAIISQSFAYMTMNLTSSSSTNVSLGGLVGEFGNESSDNALIINCFASGDISLYQTSTNYLSGLIGNFIDGILLDSYVNNYIDRLNSSYSYSYGSIYGNISSEGFTISNVYNDIYATTITNDEDLVNKVTWTSISSNANKIYDNFDENIWTSWANEIETVGDTSIMINYGYPYFKAGFAFAVDISNSTYLTKSGDETILTSVVGGKGTASYPYKIRSASGLLIAEYISNQASARNYVLEKNLILTSNFTGISKFMGTLSGANYSILGLDFTISGTSTNNYYGLFHELYGNVNNLTIISPSIAIASMLYDTTSDIGIGILAGIMKASSVITNVTITNAKITINNYTYSSQASNLAIGGLIGINNALGSGTTYDAISLVNLNDTTIYIGTDTKPGLNVSLGGAVGMNLKTTKGKIFNVVCNNVTIKGLNENYSLVANSSTTNIGGFIGTQEGGTISKCQVNNLTTAISQASGGNLTTNLGGFVGNSKTLSSSNSALIEMCSVKGDGSMNITNVGLNTINYGGFVGYENSKIVDCYTESELNAGNPSTMNLGSFVGFLEGIINYSYSLATTDSVNNTLDFVGATGGQTSSTANSFIYTNSGDNWAIINSQFDTDIWDITSMPPIFIWEV